MASSRNTGGVIPLDLSTTKTTYSSPVRCSFAAI
jgi:hypothetical protein